jgi:DNA-binding response OmpR family regulator
MPNYPVTLLNAVLVLLRMVKEYIVRVALWQTANHRPVQPSEKMTRILIADDDLSLCELLGDYLQQEGFSVALVHRGDEVLGALAAEQSELLILDVMLPGLNGFDVLKQLREKYPHLPALMLTARGDDIDRIVGLELGADDYLPKPFNPRELLARLRSVLRRVQAPEPEPHMLANGPLHIDYNTREARLKGQVLPLTSAEFGLLAMLMQNCGQVIHKDQLAQGALQRPLNAYDRSIDVHMSHLRKKLEACGGAAQWLLSVRGQGYQLARLKP